MFQLFATGVNNTGGKFAAGVVGTGGNLPPASLTPAANLPPVSLIPAAICHGVIDTGGKFATGVNELRISPRIFEKIRNDPNFIIRGLGKGDS